MKRLVSLFLAMTLILAGALSLLSCQPADDGTTSVTYTRTEDGTTYTLTVRSNKTFTLTETFTSTVTVDEEKGDASKVTSVVNKLYTGTWTEATEHEGTADEVKVTTLTYSSGSISSTMTETNPADNDSNYNAVVDFLARVTLLQRYLQDVVKITDVGMEYEVDANGGASGVQKLDSKALPAALRVVLTIGATNTFTIAPDAEE